ncbi:hypothetical protein FRC15_001280 [Serendipita sp. 397]|nr:hypothetical protein FRC15_001280 [Serendipita sp. 397]
MKKNLVRDRQKIKRWLRAHTNRHSRCLEIESPFAPMVALLAEAISAVIHISSFDSLTNVYTGLTIIRHRLDMKPALLPISLIPSALQIQSLQSYIQFPCRLLMRYVMGPKVAYETSILVDKLPLFEAISIASGDMKASVGTEEKLYMHRL